MKHGTFFKAIITGCLFLFAFTTIQSQALDGIRICIDPGHGGHTSDDRQIFLPNGIIYWESEGDLQTAFHLRDLLEELGAEVKLTRTDNEDDSDIALSERSAIANAFESDFFQSIHTNGGGGTYSLVLYKEVNGNPAFPEALEMAEIMAPDLEDLMKTNSNYVRGDYSFLGFNLGVLRYANMPSTLSESSFHDLPPEGLRLKNIEYLKNYAWAMARSFLSYFEAGEFSTGRVGGIVTDVTYGTVINEINVSCQPVGKTYTGDQYYNGFYAIGELDPGDYELVLSKEGYLNDTTQIQISANNYLDLDLTIQYYNNGYPNADFYIHGLPAGAGENLTFNAGNSTDDGFIQTYLWDFGDGSAQDTGEIVYHRFNEDGIYQVSMTAIDNDGNESDITKEVEIVTGFPAAPRLLSVRPTPENAGVKLNWQHGPETNLTSYRIYISGQRDFSDTVDYYEVDHNQNELTIDSFGVNNTLYYFRLTSENIASKESDHGDTYVFNRIEDTDRGQDILIVDGFNRNGSYTGENHDFVASYAAAFKKIDGLQIASCSNSAILSSSVRLEDYDVVCWFLGDESTADETFNSTEQQKIKAYLKKGGKLFVTGAEIGWDLVAKGSVSDQSFYRDFLKGEYLSDGSTGMSPANGIPGSGFEEIILHFGQVYPEDYPDEVGETGGSSSILNYITGASAGIKFKGYFDNSQIEAAVVNIGFPLESVGDQEEIDLFIEKLMAFFDTISDTPELHFEDEQVFRVFPTVFQDRLDIYHNLSKSRKVEIEIYDLGGNQFFHNSYFPYTGKQKTSILIETVPPGLYLLSLTYNGRIETYKIVKR